MCIRCAEKVLSYSRCTEIFKDCLKGLGSDEKKYGFHSPRSGGATAAVINNPNLSERLLKLHGRWKSDIAKDVYIGAIAKSPFYYLQFRP